MTVSVAQEFLEEREFVIRASDGREFVKRLKELLGVAANLDGKSISPPEFEADNLYFFYRGQTNGSYGINSSLYRCIKSRISGEMKPKEVETMMNKAEGCLLEQARKQGIGRNLTALELLTVLQHHLIPTRLIDVSASWEVALYFAAEAEDGKDGRLFVIAVKPSMWNDFPRSIGSDVKWPTSKQHPWRQTTWPVLLPFTDPRMISQQGYFLVGGLTTNVGRNSQYWNNAILHPPTKGAKKASLTQQELREVSTLMIKFPMLKARVDTFAGSGVLEELKNSFRGKWTAVALTIPVPAAFKSEIRDVLREEYSIDKDSIYPPIDESSRLLKHIASSVI
ncbi:FRG domain-containing protein [Dermabacteraceae bacterium P13264]